MKYSIRILLTTLFCIMGNVNAAEKNAIMMNKFEDPLAGMIDIMGVDNVAQSRNQMGAAGKIVEYKHCIQNISIKKASFKRMEKEMAEEATDGGQYNDTKSVTLIDKCPQAANASCDHGNRIEYFYTDSSKLLEDQKEGCEYFKKKWLTFDSNSADAKVKKTIQ